MYVGVYVYLSVCVCLDRKKICIVNRKRESAYVCVCVCNRKREREKQIVPLCACVGVGVCVRARNKERGECFLNSKAKGCEPFFENWYQTKTLNQLLKNIFLYPARQRLHPGACVIKLFFLRITVI